MKKHKDFWQITEDSLDKSMKVFKVEQNMRNELLNLYRILSPYPEVKNVLKYLKNKNYKISILSNGTPELLDNLVKSNDLRDFFDDIFSVEQVRVFKPDFKVYEIPVRKYNIDSSEIAYLSANTWDVSGGGNYGFNSVWVNRANDVFDKLDYKPKRVIKNLDQLLEFL